MTDNIAPKVVLDGPNAASNRILFDFGDLREEMEMNTKHLQIGVHSQPNLPEEGKKARIEPDYSFEKPSRDWRSDWTDWRTHATRVKSVQRHALIMADYEGSSVVVL